MDNDPGHIEPHDESKLPDPESLVIPSIDRDPAYKALLDQQAALHKRLDQAADRRTRAQAILHGVKPDARRQRGRLTFCAVARFRARTQPAK
jgi:hypothetical protein